MKFALKDGKYVNIKDVEKGLKCGCICPVCGKPLSKKGRYTKSYFCSYL